jgi:hypothetical protein
MTTKFVWSGSGNTTYNGASWETSYANLTSAYAAVTAGDTIFVAHDHAETTPGATSLTFTSPGTPSNLLKVICQNRTTGVAAATANVAVVGNFGITFFGSTYFYGIQFVRPVGSAVGGNFLIQSQATATANFAAKSIYESCKFSHNTGNSAASIISFLALDQTSLTVVLSNTVLSFANTSQGIALRGANVIWKNTPSAIVNTAIVPTSFLKPIGTSTIAGSLLIEDVDLSALGASTTLFPDVVSLANRIVMKRVRLGPSVTITSGIQANTGQRIVLMGCASSGGVVRHEKYDKKGTSVQDRNIIRTGGSTISKKITTTAFSSWFDPHVSLPWTVFNTDTGTNTLTVCGVYNSTVLPNNDEIWISADYLNTANADGVMVNSTIANPITANTTLSADTSVWNGAVAARIDSTVYVLNDVVKTSNNSSRIFFCTTAGTSNTAEPAGYTTAVDGSVVTDGTAAFTAGMRFKMSTIFTAGQVGSIFVKVHAAKTSNTYYIDQFAPIT